MKLIIEKIVRISVSLVVVVGCLSVQAAFAQEAGPSAALNALEAAKRQIQNSEQGSKKQLQDVLDQMDGGDDSKPVDSQAGGDIEEGAASSLLNHPALKNLKNVDPGSLK
jgi:hypothetical protein